jgi:hypothetical protein
MQLSPAKIIITGSIAIALAWLAFGYFGVQALFTNTVVNDPLPVAQQAPILNEATSSTRGEPLTAPTTTVATLAGDFTQGDSTYRINGTAKVVTQDNARTLVLSDFDVTNGPDLFVYLVAASSTQNTEVKERTAQGRFVQIAALKGNRGNQTYVLPADLDLSEYPVISIWCRRFSRNFGAALLSAE